MVTVGIVGKHGQLGRELLRECTSGSCFVRAYGHEDLDIADKESINQILTGQPIDVLVNAAAYTAVDGAELDIDTAFNVNAEGPGNLALFCSKADIPLIHISTDYVFDGTQSKPYKEDDPVSPLGIYGKSKSLGENKIRDQLTSHIIIRTSWLYSPHGRNFLTTMLRLGREKTIVQVVDDQIGCPTSAGDLAKAILKVVLGIAPSDARFWGTYHFCNQGMTTWYGLAKAIYEYARQHNDYPLRVNQLVPLTTSEYPTQAERPPYSALDCSHIKKTFQIDIRNWRQALHDTMDELILERISENWKHKKK